MSNEQNRLKERMVTSETKKKVDNLIKNSDPNYKHHSGIGGKKTEKVPALLILKNEHVITGQSNSAIVLGNDKPQGPLSGLSGRGFSGTATIDICAGRQSKRVLQSDYYLSNNFEEDAARIYVSQLTEVDANISCPTYTVAGIQTEVGKYASTVTVISDRPRIVARDNVKICTKHVGFNSIGQKINPAGIDLIAGYDAPDTEHELQPMVKGGNLLEALNKIVENLLKVQNTVEILFESQRKINNALLSHTHIVDAGTLLTDEPLGYKITPEVLKQMQDTIASLMSNQVEFTEFIVDYVSGLKTDKYILSQWNRVN